MTSRNVQLTVWGESIIHRIRPQKRKRREIVRRGTIAVLRNSGSGEIKYILRDISKIAPL